MREYEEVERVVDIGSAGLGCVEALHRVRPIVLSIEQAY